MPYQYKYNLVLNEKLTDLEIEFLCFKIDRKSEHGGLGRFLHFKNICKTLFSDLKWNSWLEEQIESLCDDRGTSRIGDTTAKEMVWTGCAAAGKAQPLNSIVYTPSGPKRMGDLTIGEHVCTPDGSSAPITAIYPQGEKEIYELTLIDGTKIQCCNEHLWEVMFRGKPMVVSTEYLRKNMGRWSGRRMFAIPFTEPVTFLKRETLIHPYLLGALLGNGSFGGRDGRAMLGFSSIDTETIQRVASHIGENCKMKRTFRPADWSISGLLGSNKVRSALQTYGLWGKLSDAKFVPDDFLFSDIKSRFEMIRGLMDTDGCVEKGQATFCTTSKRLSENLQFLIQSVGGTCRITTKIPKFTYKGIKKDGKLAYLLSIQHHSPDLLFYLPRKKGFCNRITANRIARFITQITPVGKSETQCIQIDHPNHLYLTNGVTPTHNTYASALFAVVWWMAGPNESIVILTSTTMKMVKRRIWPVVQSLYHQVVRQGGNMGHLVDSKTTLQNCQGDDKHAIFAIAVKEGSTSKAAANIQGMHAPRIFIEIDEATDVPLAIVSAAHNLQKACQDFIILKVGNANSRMDPLGEAMEPKDGWSSVNVETEEWETKSGGHCLHFDGFKSPNVKAGKTIFPFLYTYEDYQRDTRGDKVNTLEFWMFVRGFPAPEGVVNTVLSEALIFNNDGMGQHKWISTRKGIGAWDPGFGGDPAPLYFGQLGDIEGEKMGIQITERVPIVFNPNSRESIDYQIARQVIKECQARGVAPECFGMDATAIGRGVFAIVYEEWSPKIHRVEFGASPSLDIVSPDDPRKGFDVYANCVTEMWFRVRRMLEAQQLKGFTPDAIRQFATRIYDYKGKKIHLEPKSEYRSRTGRSPDDADAIAVLCEVARKLGATTSSKSEKRAEREWLQAVKKADNLHTDVSIMSETEEDTIISEYSDYSSSDAYAP